MSASDIDKQIEQLASLLTLKLATNLQEDLSDPDKRSPQLYNAATTFLKNLKFEVDPSSNTLKAPLGSLAEALESIPLPEHYN